MRKSDHSFATIIRRSCISTGIHNSTHKFTTLHYRNKNTPNMAASRSADRMMSQLPHV